MNINFTNILLVSVTIMLMSCSNSNDELMEEENPNPNKIETTLYNSDGEGIAYYVSPSEAQDIYLWNGTPTSYILTQDELLYGFNGKFLGWFQNGIIYNVEGKIVAFEQGALNISTQSTVVKGAKNVKPLKTIRGLEPSKPIFSDDWAEIALDSFLLMGIE